MTNLDVRVQLRGPDVTRTIEGRRVELVTDDVIVTSTPLEQDSRDEPQLHAETLDGTWSAAIGTDWRPGALAPVDDGIVYLTNWGALMRLEVGTEQPQEIASTESGRAVWSIGTPARLLVRDDDGLVLFGDDGSEIARHSDPLLQANWMPRHMSSHACLPICAEGSIVFLDPERDDVIEEVVHPGGTQLLPGGGSAWVGPDGCPIVINVDVEPFGDGESSVLLATTTGSAVVAGELVVAAPDGSTAIVRRDQTSGLVRLGAPDSVMEVDEVSTLAEAGEPF